MRADGLLPGYVVVVGFSQPRAAVRSVPVTDANQRHQDAMARVEEALLARRRGDHERARELFTIALRLELESAEQVPTQPSRSILFRSAAWLALEPRDAGRPSGSQPVASPIVACRTASKRNSVPWPRRPDLRLHRALPPPTAVSSLTLHMEGPEVGYGTAAPADIEPRRDALQHLIVRPPSATRATSFGDAAFHSERHPTAPATGGVRSRKA
jgi:hypothetical protein